MRNRTRIVGGLAGVIMGLAPARAERINQEGRLLGPEVTVTAPVLFNTPEADAVLAAMQIMPLDSAWNEDISNRPLLANSAAMIGQIRADLASSRRTLRAFHEMNFVLVPDAQPLVPISFLDYPDESDPSPYPIPGNTPVETWPRETGALTLAQWQQDVDGSGGDRHAIVAMPGAGTIWETWQMRLAGTQWQASNGAKFDLRSNSLRPAGWTSADAAGLPMFPALVRYDEGVRGMVEHAMRIVVRRTRRDYIYPATHYASSTPASEVNVPAMGQRVRLRADFPIPENWTIFEKAVLRGLKKYGALVADNGNFFSISVTPDDRYPANAFSNLASVDVSDFEIIQTTGRSEGPRQPQGKPSVSAGEDFRALVNTDVVLGVSAAPGVSATADWRKHAGPGELALGDAVKLGTDSEALFYTPARFSAPGNYTLVVGVRNGVHAPQHDAVRVGVVSTPFATIAPTSVTAGPNASAVLSATATGAVAQSFRWRRNGTLLDVPTEATFELKPFAPADSGLYTAEAMSAEMSLPSLPAVVGFTGLAHVTGTAVEVGPDIVHPNGKTYDQVLLNGRAASVVADLNQVVRVSFLDLNDDIVQVELAGAGDLTLVFDDVSGPSRPTRYNQDVAYVRGHAGIVVTNANETTHLTIFSVGRMTALDQTLFRDDVVYDGMADVAFVAIAGRRFGGLRLGNVSFVGTKGFVGIYAPGVEFTGPVYVGDVNAADAATAVLRFGEVDAPRITGGSLRQDNARAIEVSGFTRLELGAGTDSHGTAQPAQINAGRFEENGEDVTGRIVGPAAL